MFFFPYFTVGDSDKSRIELILLRLTILVLSSWISFNMWNQLVPSSINCLNPPYCPSYMVATGQEMVRKKFFKVREKSGNFTPSQGKFKSLREVREKWNLKGTNLFIANSAMFLCKQECELSTDVDSSHPVRGGWRPLQGLICEFSKI